MVRYSVLGLIIVGVVSLPIPTIAQDAAQKPNIIIVFIDDMGWGDLSCFGNNEVQTPSIDRLAAEGLRFSQFYVNSPICSPSRTALITGRYPQRYRIGSYLDNRRMNKRRGIANWLDPQVPTLPRMLHRAGYATGQFGKWHMGGQRDVGDAPLITEYGFDRSLTNFEGLGDRVLPLLVRKGGPEPEKYALGSDQLGRGNITWRNRDEVTTAFVDEAIRFIDESQSQNQSFYVNVWPDDVHSPFFPPLDEWGDGAKRTLYHAVLESMDQQLGKLFDKVRNSRALRDNTVILVCSDNGPEPGAGSPGRFRGHKACLYEGGIRSPLIVWAPEFMNPEVVGKWNRESVIAAIDFAPSLLEIAGVEATANAEFDGQPMADTLLGNSTTIRSRPLFFRRPPDRNQACGMDDAPDLAVRSGDWKLLCEYDGSEPQLYDLSKDPGESQNLSEEQPEVVAKLISQLVSWHDSLPPDKGETFAAPRAAKKRQPSGR